MLQARWLGSTHNRDERKERQSCDSQAVLSFPLNGKMENRNKIMKSSGSCSSFFSSGTQVPRTINNPWSCSINFLNPSALHDVILWNADNKIIKPWHVVNIHEHSSYTCNDGSGIFLKKDDSLSLRRNWTEYYILLLRILSLATTSQLPFGCCCNLKLLLSFEVGTASL